MIVFSVKPLLQEGLIDRYLVALENRDIDAVLIFNKIDMLDEEERQAYRQRLDIYRQLRYPLIETSVNQFLLDIPNLQRIAED